MDDVEINPELPVRWFAEKATIYNILMIGIDNYRYSWLNETFKKMIGFNAFDKDDKRIYLVRPSDIAKAAPIINSALLNHCVSGWDRMMCWYTNNTKKIIDPKGNTYYAKIEPRIPCAVWSIFRRQLRCRISRLEHMFFKVVMICRYSRTSGIMSGGS